MPTEDLTSDLNSDTDQYNSRKQRDSNNNSTAKRNNLTAFNFPQKSTPANKSSIRQKRQPSDSDDEIKTPDMDNIDFAFQVKIRKKHTNLNLAPKYLLFEILLKFKDFLHTKVLSAPVSVLPACPRMTCLCFHT